MVQILGLEFGMKLHQGKLTPDIRRRFFTKKVVSNWSRIPRGRVMTPSQSKSQESMDKVLGHLL